MYGDQETVPNRASDQTKEIAANNQHSMPENLKIDIISRKKQHQENLLVQKLRTPIPYSLDTINVKNKGMPESLETKTSIKKQRENVREQIVGKLIYVFALTIVASFLFLSIVHISINNKEKDNRAIDFFTLLITSQVGFIGAALGFYFGEEKK